MRSVKHQKRKSERRWRQTKLEVHHQIFLSECKRLGLILNKTKQAFFSSKIQDCGNNLKSLFKITNSLLDKKQQCPLSTASSDTVLAETFSKYFIEKVTTIRDTLKLKTDVDQSPLDEDIHHVGPLLTSFEPTSEEEIKKIIMNSPSKPCELNPIPKAVLKNV